VGRSLYEADLLDTARQIAEKVSVPLPVDVVVADARELDGDFMAFVNAARPVVKKISEIEDHDMILDIGPETAVQFAGLLKSAKTILWNGPVGVFEVDAFGNGTQTLAHAIADSTGFSIAGGGDTLAAIDKYAVTDRLGYISTGGGAFLEFVEGKTLPAVAALAGRYTA
jgi:phosphoglycerate kinase